MIALSGFERLASSPLSDEKNSRIHDHFRRPLEWCIGALQHVTSVDIAVAALGAANPIVIMIASVRCRACFAVSAFSSE